MTFRQLLLNRCQKEFEAEKENGQKLSEKFSHLEGLSVNYILGYNFLKYSQKL